MMLWVRWSVDGGGSRLWDRDSPGQRWQDVRRSAWTGTQGLPVRRLALRVLLASRVMNERRKGRSVNGVRDSSREEREREKRKNSRSRIDPTSQLHSIRRRRLSTYRRAAREREREQAPST